MKEPKRRHPFQAGCWAHDNPKTLSCVPLLNCQDASVAAVARRPRRDGRTRFKPNQQIVIKSHVGLHLPCHTSLCARHETPCTKGSQDTKRTEEIGMSCFSAHFSVELSDLPPAPCWGVGGGGVQRKSSATSRGFCGGRLSLLILSIVRPKLLMEPMHLITQVEATASQS